MTEAAFYLAGAVAIVASACVVTHARALHALLYLVVVLLSVAVMFFLLGAPFAAALEVIIYAGAIMVLFVFAIMLVGVGPDSAARERQWLRMRPRALVGPAILSLVLAIELAWTAAGGTSHTGAARVGPRDVGAALLGPYALGVEIASMLLLAALVGALHLGRRRRREDAW